MTISSSCMSLFELLSDVENSEKIEGIVQDISIFGLCADSRQLEKGDLYIALQGERVHGLDFLDQVRATASAVLVDADDEVAIRVQAEKNLDVPIVGVSNLTTRLGGIASKFNNYPSHQIPVCGITGTDGKTSVCRFVVDALHEMGFVAGYIGTLGWGIGASLAPNPLTTPDPVALQSMMAELYRNGAQFIALEVSSHALVQGRVNGVEFDVAALTNLGRDHLDYHVTLDNYRAAKQMLFEWPSLRSLVLNNDDAFGQALALQAANDPSQEHRLIRYTTENRKASDIRAENINALATGLSFDLLVGDQQFAIETSLIGKFNVQNLLATAAILDAFGLGMKRIASSLEVLEPVAGRMECFRRESHATVVVDFAHTPQALEGALTSISGHCEGALWVVFGCGGDRDRGKRPEMGEIAARFATRVVVTDDNPRTETSAAILQDIVSGIEDPSNVLVIADREAAISHAIGAAKAEDWILIAGKGHEDYQIVGHTCHPYSDREVVTRLQSLVLA